MSQNSHNINDSVKPSEKKSVLSALKPFILTFVELISQHLFASHWVGYSDPYCMLGILLGQSPKDTEEKKERRFSFRKRREKLEKRSSVKEVLAGRDIQVTEVKPETLNPVWNEHFVLWASVKMSNLKYVIISYNVTGTSFLNVIVFHSDIDDVHNDLLHLDIW